MVATRVINTRTVQEALADNRWEQDIQGDMSFMAQLQLMHLKHAVATLRRDPVEEDKFTWPCAGEEGTYSAKATYGRFYQGLVRAPVATAIGRSYALLKLKIFAWLASQNRIWTSDQRARHGLQELPSPCFTCL